MELWRTPNGQEPGWAHLEIVDKHGKPPTHANQRFYDKATGRVVQQGLTQQVARATEQWLTPNVPNGGRSVPEATVLAHGMTPTGKRTVGLESQVKFWRTPNTRDHHPPGPRPNPACGQAAQIYLAHQVALWPTPHASCSTGAGQMGRDGGLDVQTAVEMWPTASARDWKSARLDNLTPSDKRCGGINQELSVRVADFSRPDPATGPAGSGSSPPTRRLNPRFVSRLMGLPADWTVVGPLASTSFAHWETQSSRLLRHLLSAYCGDE